jgi:hypothetical protein
LMRRCVIRVGLGGYVCIAVIDHGSQLPVSCRRRPGTGMPPQERQKASGRSGGDISARPLNFVNARRPPLLSPPVGGMRCRAATRRPDPAVTVD